MIPIEVAIQSTIEGQGISRVADTTEVVLLFTLSLQHQRCTCIYDTLLIDTLIQLYVCIVWFNLVSGQAALKKRTSGHVLKFLCETRAEVQNFFTGIYN